jgi:hypothetical protein
MSVPWKRSLAESTSTWRRVNQMKRQVNSEIDDVDTKTSASKHTWRKSGKHTQRNAGEHTEQLKMISARSTGRMSSVPTSAPNRRMISATPNAPGR